MRPEYFYSYANDNSMDGLAIDTILMEFHAHRAMKRLEAEITSFFEGE